MLILVVLARSDTGPSTITRGVTRMATPSPYTAHDPAYYLV